MNLKLYHAKRNLSATQEPSGKKANRKSELQFVIQKHAARRLHYDFRLELDGVLKSWAIPKGPSLDPNVKRLAIEVEDHPLNYASFEGIIPEHHYGAGKVAIWDRGTYTVGGKNKIENEKKIREKLNKGELSFFLSGEKLHGEFALVKMKKADKKEWLLIKKSDAFQSDENISNPLSKQLEKLPKEKMPHQIKPMLAQLIKKPFDHKDWIFEIKWDGYRTTAEVTSKKATLYSRNFLSFNDKFPSIVEDLKKLKEDVILDGEIVVLDKKGVSRFQLLQNYLRFGEKEGVLKYIVFDILYYRGKDLSKLPLIQRKQILKEVLSNSSSQRIIYSDHVEKTGIAFFMQAAKKGVEGVMAKEMHSPYISRRSKNWLKIKALKRQEVVIAGFTAPKGGRKKFGALVVGVYDDSGELNYVGHVGGGFTQKLLNDVYDQLKPLITSKKPFKKMAKTNTPAIWVKPKLVCEVSFQEWTDDNSMRQPIFQGIRLDKPAKQVKKEESIEKNLPETISSKKSKTEIKNESTKNVLPTFISHPKKVFWPAEGYTKEEMLIYYQDVSKFMLPHLKQRPIVLHRFPDGVRGKDFFQKKAPDFIPPWLKTAMVQHSGKKVKYLLIPDEDSLIYIANLGSIEIHPFLSRYPQVDYPDFLVLDIDPVDLPFESAVEVAKEGHKLLNRLHINHYCKTSGKRGLHIYVPLQAHYEYEVVENLAKLLANFLYQELSSFTSLLRDPAKRQKKVYIDYLQNGRTKTVVAPYSLRATDHATVSTPLDWKEVNKNLNPLDFTIKTVPQRLKKKGDLFQPVLGRGIAIRDLLTRLTSKGH